MAEVTKLIHKYLRHDKKFPHVWCPGCGNGIFLGALIRAIDRTGFEKDQIVIVSGIAVRGESPFTWTLTPPHHPRPGLDLRNRHQTRQSRTAGHRHHG